MRVEEIRIYPVKSGRGVSVETADVEPWGLAGDRRWMIVDAVGRFLTQRTHPSLARITARLRPAGVTLSADGMPPIEVAEPARDGRGERVEVVVWRDAVAAVEADPKANAWLTAALGVACRLVHMPDPERARGVDAEFGEPEDRVSFADGFPLLVTTTSSLDELRARAGAPGLSMDRFRTNLVIGGAPPWAEDTWREIRVGNAIFAVVKPCARCAVTTVDQGSGERHPAGEPLRTLLGFRRNRRGQPTFGQNLIPRRTGEIAVGDEVVVNR